MLLRRARRPPRRARGVPDLLHGRCVMALLPLMLLAWSLLAVATFVFVRGRGRKTFAGFKIS
jgi:hypothetical protein